MDQKIFLVSRLTGFPIRIYNSIYKISIIINSIKENGYIRTQVDETINSSRACNKQNISIL